MYLLLLLPSSLSTGKERCEGNEAEGTPRAFAFGFGMHPDSRLCCDIHTRSPILVRRGEWVVLKQQPVLHFIHQPRNQPQGFRTRCVAHAFKSDHPGHVVRGLLENLSVSVWWCGCGRDPTRSPLKQERARMILEAKSENSDFIPRWDLAWKYVSTMQ